MLSMSTEPANPLEVRMARLEGSYEQINLRLSSLEGQVAEIRGDIRGLRGRLGDRCVRPACDILWYSRTCLRLHRDIDRRRWGRFFRGLGSVTVWFKRVVHFLDRGALIVLLNQFEKN